MAKSFKVLWAKSAQNDLEQIIEYIKIDNIDTAKNVFLELNLSAMSCIIFQKNLELFQSCKR